MSERKFHHPGLASGRWFKLTLIEQMANVGSDVERAIQWRKKGDLEYSRMAFERALELLDLTKMDPKNRKRLKEVCRTREVLVDYFMYDNVYGSTDELLQKYFLEFGMAAAILKGK